jgi:hypothetical protein
MIAVLRSELNRTLMIRASWVSIAATIALGLTFGVYSADFWTLFAGIGAFGLAVLTTGQHYQHRTAMLLMLGEPRRWRLLIGQCVAAAVVATVTTALSGLTVADEPAQWRLTVGLTPIIAVLGVAVATLVRRPTWAMAGTVGWLLIAEGLLGKLRAPLPFSAYLNAASGEGDSKQLFIFVAWTAAALVAAGAMIRRDMVSH